MRIAPLILLLAAGLAAPVASHGQTLGTVAETAIPASVVALEEKEQRRLNFYAEKVVVEVKALIAASQNADLAGFNKHGRAMKSTAERLIGDAERLGLTRDETEQLFQHHLWASGTGALPFFLADDAGNTDLGRILALEVKTEAPQTGGSDYVNAIRNAGENLFGD
jgi:hypothetical protein